MIKISANHDNHDNLRSIRYWQKMLLNPLSQQLKQLSKSSSHLKVTNRKSANYNGGQYIMIKISANHDNHDNLRSIRYWQKMLLNPPDAHYSF